MPFVETDCNYFRQFINTTCCYSSTSLKWLLSQTCSSDPLPQASTFLLWGAAPSRDLTHIHGIQMHFLQEPRLWQWGLCTYISSLLCPHLSETWAPSQTCQVQLLKTNPEWQNWRQMKHRGRTTDNAVHTKGKNKTKPTNTKKPKPKHKKKPTPRGKNQTISQENKHLEL